MTFVVYRVGATLLILLLLAGPLSQGLDDPDPTGSGTLSAVAVAVTITEYLINHTASSTNVTNSQFDVLDEVCFSFRIYAVPFSHVQYLNLSMWYDFGKEVEDIGLVFYNVTPGEKVNIELSYTNTSGTGIFALDWPSSGIVSVTKYIEEVHDANNHTLSFCMEFLPQAMWTPGDINGTGDGVWTPPVDPHTGFGAYNDRNSWNFIAAVDDDAGNSDAIFDEFGIYRYSEVTHSGIPSGAANPGGARVTLSTGTGSAVNVTYRSNADLRIGVETTDLFSGAATIAASNLGVSGGDILSDTSFTGPGSLQYPIGTSSDWTWSPDLTGFDVGGGDWWDQEDITWYGSIPAGKPNGTYSGTMTYRLQTDPDPRTEVSPTGGPPFVATFAVGNTSASTTDVFLSDLVTQVPIGALFEVRRVDDSRLLGSFLMGEGTTSGPPLFLPLPGEFIADVGMSEATPFDVYLRVYDAATKAAATEFGDSAPVTVTGTGTYILSGWFLTPS